MAYDFNKQQFERDVPFHRYFLKIKADILLSELEKKGKRLNLLDVGCNDGELEELIANKFNTIVGIDVILNKINKAKAKIIPNCKFLVMSGLSMKFEKNTFDAVIIVNILHHVPDTLHVKVLKESYRVLKNEGCLLIFEHNPHNPLVYLRFNYLSKIDKGCKMITPKNLSKNCRMAGFRNNVTKYIAKELWGEYYLVSRK